MRQLVTYQPSSKTKYRHAFTRTHNRYMESFNNIISDFSENYLSSLVFTDILRGFNTKVEICTLMSLVNLADSSWSSVDCNVARIPNIVCSRSQKSETDTIVQTTSNYVCHQKSISKGESCYLFQWFDGDVMNRIDMHKQCKTILR